MADVDALIIEKAKAWAKARVALRKAERAYDTDLNMFVCDDLFEHPTYKAKVAADRAFTAAEHALLDAVRKVG